MSRLMSAIAVAWSGVELVRKRAFELLLPMRVRRKRVAGDRAPLSVELEQLFGHVAHRLLDACLGLFPGGPAQTIERRPGPAGVLLNEIQPFNGNEELVVAVVANLEELLHVGRGPGDRAADGAQLLEADEFADAVIDMDDQVADLEIAQVGQERLRQIAPLLGRSALLLENIRLRVQLQRTAGETEAARERADGDEHPGRMDVFGAFDRNGDDLELVKDFDRPLGASGTVGNEQHRVAAIAGLPNVGDPVADATAEFERGLTRDMVDPLIRAFLVRAFNGELFEPPRGPDPGVDGVPGRERPIGWNGGDVPPSQCVGVAAVELLANLPDLLLDLLALGHDDPRAMGGRQEVKDRQSLVVVVESFAHRHDRHLIDGAGGALRRWIESAQRLDHVADELQADRLAVAGGKHIEDAAADRERAMLVNRVRPGEAGIDEQIRQRLRIDFRARPDFEGRAEESLRWADPGQQCGRGRDDQSGTPGSGSGQRPRTRCRDAEVRRHPAVGIDLQRRQRQHGALRGLL